MAREQNLLRIAKPEIRSIALVAGLMLIGLSTCRTVPSEPESPARIVNPTRQSRATLAKAVTEALNGRPVTLADDALTRSSDLIIERVRIKDPSGLPIDGRDSSPPEHFRLVKRGAHCVLIHSSTGKRMSLPHTECSPQ